MATTDENEIVGEVELCASDGRRLNPAARGWSRRPLHRANLRGSWGRTKRWDYWAILTDEFFVSVTYADVDYIGLATVEWGDLRSGGHGGRAVTVPLARGIDLPDVPGSTALRYRSRHLDLEIGPDGDDTHISVSWTDRDGTNGAIDVIVEDPPGHESVNVVIPWSDTRFQFTSKHQARPVRGSVSFDGVEHRLGSGGLEAWGVLDVGRGRWPYRTIWNWAGGAGHTPCGRVVGLQLGGRWTDGTGYTESGVIIDGRVVKLGDASSWDYSWSEPMRPWRVSSGATGLDLTLTPSFDRHARTNLLVLSTEVHQVFGRWTGVVPDGEGGVIDIGDIVGFAEESRSRW